MNEQTCPLFRSQLYTLRDLKFTKDSGDPKTRNSKSGHFEGRLQNGNCHSKTGRFKYKEKIILV